MLRGEEGGGENVVEAHDVGFATGIMPSMEYAPRLPAKRKFKPWHKPRKQFIRRDQWAKEILAVFAGRDDAEPLRYLGLPGVDLLDLRYFQREVCIPLGRRLLFLGFEQSAKPGNSASTDLNTSLDEVLRLEHVESRSDVLWDDFRNIGIATSIAWKAAKDMGPFDVVNLDLMDGMASSSPASGSIYNAVQYLLGLQVRRHRPWLLLLTTRVGREHFDGTASSLLLQRLDQNLLDCEEFKAALESCVEGDYSSAVAEGWDDRKFFLIMVTCMCKWLFALAQHLPSTAAVARPLGYQIASAASEMDMISLALRFEPLVTPAPDPLGLAIAAPPQVDDCAAAAKVPKAVAATVNVDDLLVADAAVTDSLIDEVMALLKEARYDVSTYKQWLGIE